MLRSWLARHLFYPAQDLLSGRRSLEMAEILAASQWWSRAQLDGLQDEKLRCLLAHAAREVPFYARRFAEAGVEVGRIQGSGDVSRLPLLTKDDIRAQREDMEARNWPGKLSQSCTSGSTGSPLIFQVCSRREQSDVSCRIRAHRWFDIKPGDPGIYLWGSRIEIGHQDRLRAFRDWLINEKLLSAFTLTDQQLHCYADYFLRSKPYYVFSYASSMWRFAQFVRACRPELKGVIRRVAFASGERMLPHWREEIIQSLECSVAEEYGCREAGLITHECPHGGHHLMAENILLEVLDDAGRPVPAGQEGRIVVTNLEAYGMPFIRYDTGDRTALLNEACTCGRGLPLLARPTGRTFEMLETQDGTKITGVSLSRDLKEIEGIAHYRVIQEARNRVRVLVVPNDRYHKPSARAGIARCVSARIGPGTEVLIEECDALPPHASGKYHYVINAIQSQ